MSELRRISLLAVLFTVLLRMAIGWQFFYEGLWKYNSLNTAKPWTAEGYLSNARGPLRDHFRGMVSDPDGLHWLDYDHVDKRWAEWEEKFTKHYELTDKQQADLKRMLDGPDEFAGRGRFREFAKGISIGGSLARDQIIVARKDSKNRFQLIVDGKQHLLPRESDNLIKLGKKVEAQAKKAAAAAKAANDDAAFKAATEQAELAKDFHEAVDDVYKRSSRLSYREQLAALLKGDPSRVSIIRKEHAEGTIDHKRPSKTGEYKDRLKRYEEAIADAKMSFQQEHLNREAREIRELKTELVGPIRALDSELKSKARAMLTEEQLAKGPLPKPDVFAEVDPTNINVDQADVITMWALMILGVLLIVGLFSRITAFLGALLVLSFYLVMPPWPGVPPAPGPEHSLIVNKNLIEILALLALAFIPSGKWFGLDSFFVGLFPGRYVEPSGPRRRRNSSSAKSAKTASASSLSPAERVVKKNESSDESKKKEPVKAETPAGETYKVKSEAKSS